MNRRDFTFQMGAAGALAAVPMGTAWAQLAPVEGKDYTRLQNPVPVAGTKIEVIEFFGYWCPHCAAFEPSLDAWVRKLPADVNFRRIPVLFSPPQETLRRLYFALEAMGAVPAMHGKVFVAIHGNRQRLDKEADIISLANANGVDGAKLIETMKSFSISSKLSQAKTLTQAYHIDGVPTVAVSGRFTTSPGQAGTNERALVVMDALIQRARQGK